MLPMPPSAQSETTCRQQGAAAETGGGAIPAAYAANTAQEASKAARSEIDPPGSAWACRLGHRQGRAHLTWAAIARSDTRKGCGALRK